MTRKHFQAVADAINNARLTKLEASMQTDGYKSGRSDGIRTIALRLADKLGDFNPRFNRDEFLAACYAESID